MLILLRRLSLTQPKRRMISSGLQPNRTRFCGRMSGFRLQAGPALLAGFVGGLLYPRRVASVIVAITARPSAMAAAIAINSDVVMTVSPRIQAALFPASGIAFRSTSALPMCAPSHGARPHISRPSCGPGLT